MMSMAEPPYARGRAAKPRYSATNRIQDTVIRLDDIRMYSEYVDLVIQKINKHPSDQTGSTCKHEQCSLAPLR